MQRAFAAAALLVSTSALADSPVPVNVENLTPNIARQVQRHAALGEKSLARYLERVRAYQRLAMEDVVRPATPVPAPIAKRRAYRKHAADWHRKQDA